MGEYARIRRRTLGIVSPEVPLISNLDNWLNISLIKQYHQNMPEDRACRLALDNLERFNLAPIAQLRPSALDDRQRFLVMLLRACAVPDAHLAIDRPFLLLPGENDGSFLMDHLAMLDDLYTECRIFDFSHLKDRYHTGHGA